MFEVLEITAYKNGHTMIFHLWAATLHLFIQEILKYILIPEEG